MADPANIELIGADGLTVELKQFYDRLLLERAVPLKIHEMWGLKRNIPARGGKSIEWRRLETIDASTTALTEGTPPTETRITWSNVQATVSQYGQFTNLSDLVETQSFDPVVAELTEANPETMMDSRDQVVRNVVTAGTTVQYADTAGSRGGVGSGMYFDYAEIREAVATLRGNNTRPVEDGYYVGILHPNTERDMMADSDILTTMQNAGVRGDQNPLMQGRLTLFYGVKWMVTTNARIFSSAGLSGADVYGTMIFGAGYYGVTELETQSAEIIVKALGSAGTHDPLNQVSTVGYKTALAAARLNENFGVRVEHVTTDKNAA